LSQEVSWVNDKGGSVIQITVEDQQFMSKPCTRRSSASYACRHVDEKTLQVISALVERQMSAAEIAAIVQEDPHVVEHVIQDKGRRFSLEWNHAIFTFVGHPSAARVCLNVIPPGSQEPIATCSFCIFDPQVRWNSHQRKLRKFTKLGSAATPSGDALLLIDVECQLRTTNEHDVDLSPWQKDSAMIGRSL